MKPIVGKSGIIVAVVLLACVAAIGVWSRRQSSSLSKAVAPSSEDTPTTKWWQTRFEPGKIEYGEGVGRVEFREENVTPDLHCGYLDGARLDKNGNIFLWGWAYDPGVDDVAQGVVILDGKKQAQVSVRMGMERPDVAEFLGKPSLRRSGWSALISRRWLRPGDHVFRAYAIVDDRNLGELTGEARVSVPGGQPASQ